MDKNKQPTVRFEWFNEDWQEYNFESVYFYLQNNTLSRAELSYDLGTAKNIHYGDVLVKFGECLDVSSEELPMVQEESTVKKYKNSFLQNGDIIIADTAEDETVGKCCEIEGIENEKVLSGLHTIPCRPKQKFAKGYLGYYMNSNFYHDQLLPLMQGIKVTSISKSAIQDTTISCPTKEEEQKLIGEFFKNIDRLIHLHENKYEKLKEIKQAMLEKMFPKDGESVPEIRFKGFSGEWEQCKFGQLGSIAMNKRIFKEQTFEEGEIPFYKIGTFGGKADAYISRELFEEYKQKYPYPKVGDILISVSGSIGRTVEFNGADEYFQDSNIVWLKHDERILNSFLKYLYEVVEWSGIEGSTIKRLYNDNILKTEIFLPNTVEQKQIGEIFKQLDNLIILQKQALEGLINIKKSLLEKMFI